MYQIGVYVDRYYSRRTSWLLGEYISLIISLSDTSLNSVSGFTLLLHPTTGHMVNPPTPPSWQVCPFEEEDKSRELGEEEESRGDVLLCGRLRPSISGF